MAKKKFSIGEIIFWLIVGLWLLSVLGCASQTRQTPKMDSNHYVAATETGRYQPGRYGPRNYGPTSVYQSDVNHQHFSVGGYSFKETSMGFSESYWSFKGSRTKSYRVVSHWRTRRYHWP